MSLPAPPMNSPLSLLSLPVEVIGDVLAILGVVDLLACTQVNRHVYGIIADSSRLQFTIELSKYRMSSRLPDNPLHPYVKRLNSLRDREHAWRSLKWHARHRLGLPRVASIYEFVGGIYGNGRDHDRQDPIPGISFFQLPYAGPDNDSSTKYEMWTHPFHDLNILDFTIDPAQDLLVLVTHCPPESPFVFELHLRTLESNEPHPRAASPNLPCFAKDLLNAPPSNVAGAIRIQISGDLIGFLMKEMDTIEVWHPESGYCSSFVLPSGIEDFTFISQTSFLIVRPTGFLEVYKFHKPSADSRPPALLGSFAFPPLRDGPRFWHSSLSTNPTPGYEAAPEPSRCANHLYYPTLSDRIIACCVYIVDPSDDPLRPRVYSFVFFFPVHIFLEESPHSILNLCKSEPPSDRSDVHPTDTIFFSSYHYKTVDENQPHNPTATNMYPVAWDDWGPPNTRWFRECLVTDWQHAVHGMRTAETISAKVWNGSPKDSMEGVIVEVETIDEEGEQDVIDDRVDNFVEYGAVTPPLPNGMPEPPAVVSRRYLRVRDFNPYAIRLISEADNAVTESSTWRGRRVITTESECEAHEVFTQDIKSSLPYAEVVSRQAFDMTDVMMDDCRILLLKTGHEAVDF
ncbi:hypothetical protein BDZ89DRAFT_1076385 [Hymenopellis radicata]|nr:hypothetical protein BDZ89DRAFT_1076385 [Hymenopellis radicata]